MRRYHSRGDARVRARRKKEARLFGVDLEANNFRNRHPLDCGHSRCCLCHAEKIYRDKTPQEVRAGYLLSEAD